MTDDPKRLIHASEHSLERELLSSLREISPPAGALEQGWQDMLRNAALVGVAVSVGQNAAPTALSAGSLGQAGALTPTTMPTASGTVSTWLGAKVATKLAAAKLMLVVSVAGVGVGGSLWAMRHATRVAPMQAPVATSPIETQSLDSVVGAHEPQIVTSAVAPPPELVAAPRGAVGKSVSAGELLLRESKALAEARAQLRRGDTAGASATLQKLDAEFPRGRLTQEREVLHIELLAATGRAELAATRASKFLKRHPESPHAAHVRRFATSQ